MNISTINATPSNVVATGVSTVRETSTLRSVATPGSLKSPCRSCANHATKACSHNCSNLSAYQVALDLFYGSDAPVYAAN